MEPSVLESLYHKYYRAAYIYTFSLCKSKEITEDIVSDAFEKAFSALEDEVKHFKYWLFVVCKNLWLNHLKKNKSIVNITSEDQLIEAEKVLESILQVERNQKIYKSIMKLPKRYQEILILHYYGEIPIVDIAKILNISGSNAKTLIFRARTSLKKVMEEDGYEF